MKILSSETKTVIQQLEKLSEKSSGALAMQNLARAVLEMEEHIKTLYERLDSTGFSDLIRSG